jgi:short-subunit dehydrogenase
VGAPTDPHEECRMQPYEFAGGTAVLTGAASGIGASLAAALADRGSHLALLDIDEHGLTAVADAVLSAHPHLTVTGYVVDLTDDDALDATVEAVRADHAGVTLLVNNAGVALGGRFDQVTPDDVDWVMAVNFRAPMRLTYALLPDLLDSPGSHLVNVSSLFGLIAPPGQSAYSASKFALRGLTEALRHELPSRGVGVTAVHPGGIRTNIATNARVGSGVSEQEHALQQRQWQRMLAMEPDDAARVILDGVRRRDTRVLVGWDTRAPDAFARLLPGSYGPWLARAMAVAGRLR